MDSGFANNTISTLTKSEFIGQKRIILSRVTPVAVSTLHCWLCMCYIIHLGRRSSRLQRSPIETAPTRHNYINIVAVRTVDGVRIRERNIIVLQMRNFATRSVESSRFEDFEAHAFVQCEKIQKVRTRIFRRTSRQLPQKAIWWSIYILFVWNCVTDFRIRTTTIRSLYKKIK